MKERTWRNADKRCGKMNVYAGPGVALGIVYVKMSKTTSCPVCVTIQLTPVSK